MGGSIGTSAGERHSVGGAGRFDTTEAKPRDGTVFTNKFLSNAFEGKSFAEYAWRSDKVKKYWEVKPFVCKVTLPSGEDKNCESSDEWEELVGACMK